MAVPLSQAYTVASYILRQKFKGVKRYPLVLMLEPLFRCNLECAGCGKIQYPKDILMRNLTPEQCFRAVDECGAPIVSIPGGEPLLHPEIKDIIEGLILRKKYVYLCTNALLLRKKFDLFKPSKYFTFSIHIDGIREDHDKSVCKDGAYDVVVDAIREAVKLGFRVTTNTTIFKDSSPERIRLFFDDMMVLGVEGMTLSSGYNYQKAPNQDHFLSRVSTNELFAQVLSNFYF